MKCENCKYPLLPKYSVCPKCGMPITVSVKKSIPDFDAEPTINNNTGISNVDVINGKAVWSIAPGEIARRITEKEMYDCKAVKGVVVQDGVIAAVFANGQLIDTLDSGVYQFAAEDILVRTRTITIERPETTEEAVAEDKRKSVFGFIKKLFGAKEKNEASRPLRSRNKNKEKKTETIDEKLQRTSNNPIVVVYLISTRVFQEVFGAEASKDTAANYQPFIIKIGNFDIEVGVSMQLQVTDAELFRRNYLADTNSVSVMDLQAVMHPWVEQILQQKLTNEQLQGNTLTAEQCQNIASALVVELEQRLFGVRIVKVLDIVSNNEDFNRLRKTELELWNQEQEIDKYQRECEFRNRFTSYRQEQELTEFKSKNQADIAKGNLENELLNDMNKLNQDKLLTEDEFEKFVELHKLEVRVRKARLDRDEQEQIQDVEIALNELKSKKLLSDDEFAAIEQNVRDKSFERSLLSDVLQQNAMAKADINRLQNETEYNLRQSEAEHRLKMQQADFESEELKKRNDHERTIVEDEIALRRLQDDYDDEIEDKKRRREHEDWNEAFERDGKEYDRMRSRQVSEIEFDFDIETRRQKNELDIKMQADRHDHEMNILDEQLRQSKAEFDFDQAIRRQEADTENEIKRQTIYDSESQRRQDELKLKSDLAMRNMKMMMDAKREARKDELDIRARELEIQSGMTAEQIAASKLSEIDAVAQAKFMDAMKESKSSEKENEALRREMEYKEQAQREYMQRTEAMHQASRSDMKAMMAEMSSLARHSMDTSARISEAASNAMRNTQQIEAGSNTPIAQPQHSDEHFQEEELKAIPLNTAWLRAHGYEGSFNELAGELNNRGASISQEFDESGNPIIVVEGLLSREVLNVLRQYGVQF